MDNERGACAARNCRWPHIFNSIRPYTRRRRGVSRRPLACASLRVGTAYVEAKGDARVPYVYRTADGYPLGGWVSRQRGKKDKLSADRRQQLESLDGWVWVTRARPSKHGRKKP